MPPELKFTSANFHTEVLGSDVPVMVDFWASWCLPCKAIEPILSELAEDYKGKVKIGKINVDQNRKIASQCGIQGLPTFILFSSGRVIDRRTGSQSKSQLKEMLNRVS